MKAQSLDLIYPFFLSTVIFSLCLNLAFVSNLDVIQSILKMGVYSSIFLMVNCLYFMRENYVEENWVKINSIALIIFIIQVIGSFAS